jgi:hypothetical protein
MFFPKHERLNPLIRAHMGGVDALGPHWSQPGRRIVEDLLDAVPFPVQPALYEGTDAALTRLPNLYDGGGHPVAERIAEPAPTGGSGWAEASAVRIKRDSSGRTWALGPARGEAGTWKWDNLEAYLRTASAQHAYHEAHPEDKAKRGRGGAEGDNVERLIARIRTSLAEKWEDGEEIEVAWPLVLMMVKRESR